MAKYKRVIRYYTCDYKCGHKAVPKDQMLNHEKICFCNPKNKACRICDHAESRAHTFRCNERNLLIYNNDTDVVYDLDKNEIWSNLIPFTPSEERPFPRFDCDYFKQGKKAY